MSDDTATLAGARVLDSEGRATCVGDLWRPRGAVLVFLRHFACPGCWEQTDALAARLPELARLDLPVAFVGLGSVEALARFVEGVRLRGSTARFFTDPDGGAHRAAGLSRSGWGTFGPRAVASALRGYARGFGARRRADDGDVLQQGGALVVDGAGALRFAHRGRHPGDLAAASAVVEAALRLRGAAAPGAV